MATTTGAPSLSRLIYVPQELALLILDQHISDVDETHVQMLREHYLCLHFRILVIGRANAGKTTILEKVCGVAKGTKPIIIFDMGGKSV